MPQNPPQQGHAMLKENTRRILLCASFQVQQRFFTGSRETFPRRNRQNLPWIIIVDPALGFVLWLHHRLQTRITLGDSFSRPQLLIKLSGIHGTTNVWSTSQAGCFALTGVCLWGLFWVTSLNLDEASGRVCAENKQIRLKKQRISKHFHQLTTRTHTLTLSINKLPLRNEEKRLRNRTVRRPSREGILGNVSLSGDSTHTLPFKSQNTHTFPFASAWSLTPLRINMCNSGEILHYHGNRASCPMEKRTAKCTVCVFSPTLTPLPHCFYENCLWASV